MQPVSASGLRERKKRETRLALAGAARELVLARGLDAVTIDDIAVAADVSPRTFFNHFASKEEAIVGIDPGALAEMADDLRARPAGEPPRDALRAVLVSGVDTEAMVRRWEQRNELVRRYPALLPRYLEGIVQLEEALAAALADRLGTDLARDPAPRVLAAAALAIV